jgi:hypothetical protein
MRLSAEGAGGAVGARAVGARDIQDCFSVVGWMGKKGVRTLFRLHWYGTSWYRVLHGLPLVED